MTDTATTGSSDDEPSDAQAGEASGEARAEAQAHAPETSTPSPADPPGGSGDGSSSASTTSSDGPDSASTSDGEGPVHAEQPGSPEPGGPEPGGSDSRGSDSPGQSDFADITARAERARITPRSFERRSAADALVERANGAGEGGSASSGPPSSARPHFTRPPGMVPPPGELHGATGDAAAASDTTTGGGTAVVTEDPPGPDTVAVRPIVADHTATAAGEAVRTRSSTTPRGPRRARLHLKRMDPWSVMKFSFAVSLVLFIVVIVAASVLYLALDAMGVFTSINETVAELIQSGGGEGAGGFAITAQGVIGTAAVLGALNVLLFTSLATLGAFVYNVCADLVGGVEVTLAERD